MLTSRKVHAPALSLPEAAMLKALDDEKRPNPKDGALMLSPPARAMSARKTDVAEEPVNPR